MKNPFQLQAWVFKLACLEDCSADTVATTIRREDRETFQEVHKHLEPMATKMKSEYDKAYGPAAQAYMRQANAEIGLRGDVQAELFKLTTTDPRDIREIMRQVQLIGANETFNGSGQQPPDLVNSLEYLEAAGVDCKGYRATLDELYPQGTADDDDDGQPVLAGEVP